jgi:hypothetical protein
MRYSPERAKVALDKAIDAAVEHFSGFERVGGVAARGEDAFAERELRRQAAQGAGKAER